ncbi:MAG: FUSC family protein, partial [Candidatus Nanopelagicales bacterium]
TPLQAALLITIGGLLQSLAMIVPYLLTNPGALRIAGERQPPWWPQVRAHLRWPDPYVNHAVRLTLAVTFATALADSTSLEHQYWLPMTVAWVTQSGRTGTVHRVISRVLGTIGGLIVVFLVIELLKAHGQWFSVICAISAGVAVACITANYVYAVVGITTLVLTLLFMDGDPLGSTMWQRLAETVAAGVIAIVALSIWPDRSEEETAPEQPASRAG